MDNMNSKWRPIGSWGLTINMLIIPWLAFGLLIFQLETAATLFLGIYAGTVSAWLVAAGIRQNQKNHLASLENEISIDEMSDYANDIGIRRNDHLPPLDNEYK